MRRELGLILVAIVIVSLCEEEREFCGEEETEIAHRYRIFKNCVPLIVECSMIRNKFWFKGTFLDCADKLDRFAADNKFSCTHQNGTFGIKLECSVDMKSFARANVAFFLIVLCSAFLLTLLIVHLVIQIWRSMRVHRNVQELDNRVFLCFSADDVNNIVRDCATQRAARG